MFQLTQKGNNRDKALVHNKVALNRKLITDKNRRARVNHAPKDKEINHMGSKGKETSPKDSKALNPILVHNKRKVNAHHAPNKVPRANNVHRVENYPKTKGQNRNKDLNRNLAKQVNFTLL